MNPATPKVEKFLAFDSEGTEVIALWRNKSQVEIHNLDNLSLRAFRALAHESESIIVRQTCDEFPDRYETWHGSKPDTVPLTEAEREILIASLQNQPMIRKEVSPWNLDRHEEYRGMRIVVCPDAETKRREMIES